MTDTSTPPVVLVTGAAGNIGSALVRALEADFTVVATDIERPDPAPRAGHAFACDLTDDAQVKATLAQVRTSAGARLAGVVHLAAYYDFAGEPSPLYDQLTVQGTRRLLQGLADFEVQQFVFSSSLLVMAPAEKGQVIDESSPVEAEWDYPRSKVEAEKMIRQHRGPIPSVALRVAGVYTDMGESIPICQQIRRIYEKDLESYFFPGNADHGQSFVHLDDVVGCIVSVIEARNQLAPEEVFLVGEPDVVTYEELQNRIGEALHGKEWPTLRIPRSLAKAGAWIKDKLSTSDDTFIKPWMIDLADAHYPVSIDRIRSKTGWEPQHRLRDTLTTILDRLKADPVKWYKANGFEVPEDLARSGGA